MSSSLAPELAAVERHFGEVEIGPEGDWFIVKRVPLPEGWNKSMTQVLVLVPGGYPTTPPDNFWADADLRLSGGGLPEATSPDQQQVGRAWLQFSYHVESGDWRPTIDIAEGHNLVTYFDGILHRLGEPS